MAKYPVWIQSNVDYAEAAGHKLVSQGCALFRCTRCSVQDFLDGDDAGKFCEGCVGECTE